MLTLVLFVGYILCNTILYTIKYVALTQCFVLYL